MHSAIAALPWGPGGCASRESSMTASHDLQHTSDLVAGPKPVASAAGAKVSALDRFGTPLWIAIGISIVALAVLAAFG